MACWLCICLVIGWLKVRFLASAREGFWEIKNFVTQRVLVKVLVIKERVESIWIKI